jgi:hypothetical protein
VRESVAKSDARRGGFDEFAGARAIEHARLSGHVGLSFYTGGTGRKDQSRREKDGKGFCTEIAEGTEVTEKRNRD